MNGTKRGPGRPRKHGLEAARLNLATRLSTHVHQALQQSATSNGRSISEEIERRLEQSFEMERRAGASGQDTLDLLHCVQLAILYAEARTKRAWKSDVYTKFMVQRAVLDILADLIGGSAEDIKFMMSVEADGMRAAHDAQYQTMMEKFQRLERDTMINRIAIQRGVSRDEALKILFDLTEPKDETQ